MPCPLQLGFRQERHGCGCSDSLNRPSDSLRPPLAAAAAAAAVAVDAAGTTVATFTIDADTVSPASASPRIQSFFFFFFASTGFYWHSRTDDGGIRLRCLTARATSGAIYNPFFAQYRAKLPNNVAVGIGT